MPQACVVFAVDCYIGIITCGPLSGMNFFKVQFLFFTCGLGILDVKTVEDPSNCAYNALSTFYCMCNEIDTYNELTSIG